MTVAMQWFGESVTTLDAVFSAWSVRKAYKKNKFSRELEEQIQKRSTEFAESDAR